MKTHFDSIVVGGGHAGVEASMALAKQGLSSLLLSMSLSNIAKMSCNPSIGGIAKGHLVREIDALGGQMGCAIDRTGIQFRMLNLSKGPAVWAPRAQADKQAYQDFMKQLLEENENITLKEDIVCSFIVEDNIVKGVITKKGIAYYGKAIIVTTGTFLKGLIHVGDYNEEAGRMGEASSVALSDHLKELGFNLGRLKTGTPARVHKDSIDYSKVDVQEAQNMPFAFSYSTKEMPKTLIDCYITYTNKNTHSIISSNLDKSPLFKGKIKGIGPRYCPSIEDKVVRFSQKDRHQIFIEPEGLNTDEIYLNGLSSSLPKDVQIDFLHSIRGLEKAEILRIGYAVEYDFCNPIQLKHTLETKLIKNLYFAGQINGTSGYEEAAAQGLFAGINAGLKINKRKPFTMDRTESYIAVLVDDLITKGVREPYRLFTSRAEYRLNLRYDNADIRLMHYGHSFGLICDELFDEFKERQKKITAALSFVKLKNIGNEDFDKSSYYKDKDIKRGTNLSTVIKRNDVFLSEITHLYGEFAGLSLAELKHVETNIKYEGYIKKQNEQIERFKRLENKEIDASFDYDKVEGLLSEAREKLKKIRPTSLGQAGRIEGVNPSDIAILMIYMR